MLEGEEGGDADVAVEREAGGDVAFAGDGDGEEAGAHDVEDFVVGAVDAGT